MSRYKIAAVQMTSTPIVAENIATVCRLVERAAQQGAQLVLLPEYWPILGMREGDKFSCAEAFGVGPLQDCLANLARQHQIWLIGGTLPLLTAEPDKVLNTSLVYNPLGECVARYDKIHLFSFSKGRESYNEARTMNRGAQVTAFDAPFGRVGLSICYDLRFPELYRALGHCALLVVPSAFTYTTGQAHWEVLLRARAIENQCYVLAAAQSGQHINGRRTWGHSMLIDPWGEIKVVLPEGEGIISDELDLSYLEHVRTSLPALKHRQF